MFFSLSFDVKFYLIKKRNKVLKHFDLADDVCRKRNSMNNNNKYVFLHDRCAISFLVVLLILVLCCFTSKLSSFCVSLRFDFLRIYLHKNLLQKHAPKFVLE